VGRGEGRINYRKHGVRMREAIPVFDDPYAITITDDESDPDEQRFLTMSIGAMGRLRLLVVVYTCEARAFAPFRRALPKPMSAGSRGRTMKDRYDFSKGKRGRVVLPEPEPEASSFSMRES